MEDQAAAKEEEIEHLEQEDGSNIGDALVDIIDTRGSYRDAVLPEFREISRMLGIAGEEKLYEEWSALQEEVVSTAKKFDAFRTRLIKEVKIPDMRNQLAVTQNLLNDVRREVGLDVESDETESEIPDQPQNDSILNIS